MIVVIRYFLKQSNESDSFKQSNNVIVPLYRWPRKPESPHHPETILPYNNSKSEYVAVCRTRRTKELLIGPAYLHTSDYFVSQSTNQPASWPDQQSNITEFGRNLSSSLTFDCHIFRHIRFSQTTLFFPLAGNRVHFVGFFPIPQLPVCLRCVRFYRNFHSCLTFGSTKKNWTLYRRPCCHGYTKAPIRRRRLNGIVEAAAILFCLAARDYNAQGANDHVRRCYWSCQSAALGSTVCRLKILITIVFFCFYFLFSPNSKDGNNLSTTTSRARRGYFNLNHYIGSILKLQFFLLRQLYLDWVV